MAAYIGGAIPRHWGWIAWQDGWISRSEVLEAGVRSTYDGKQPEGPDVV